MILLCEHPAAVAGAKVENGFFVFQGRRPSFAPVCGMRERPINSSAYPPWRTARGTRGLLSMGTISGYGVAVRSIQ